MQLRSESRCATFLLLSASFVAICLDQVRGDATPASNVDVQQSAYRSSIAQEAVRKQTDKIQAELAQLIQELKLNGLSSAGTGSLANASSHLSSLSQEEMQKVINALQSASISSDDPKRQAALITAYQGQKDVVLKLKSLATQLAAQQARDGLVSQIENLVVRQSTNLRQTGMLNTTPDKFDVKEKSIYGLVTAEQTSIGGEIDLLFTSVSAAASATPPDQSTDTAKAILDAMNGTQLKTVSPLAIQLTTAGPFPDAVTKQTAVRDYLVTVLRAATSKEDAEARLEQAKTQLDQVAADQKDLTETTKQAKLDGTTLAARQSEINERAEVAKALLKPINSQAADQVGTAQQDMQKSTATLTSSNDTMAAVPPQTDASKALADAQKLLDQQIAAVQSQQNQTPTDAMAQLQKVQDEIKQAQAAAQNNPEQAAKELQTAQQDALAQSPDAANQIADAADKLQQAQPDTNSANQDLAKANEALQKQEDALAKAAQDYQALAAASQQLDQAKQLATDANQNLQQSTGNNLTDPARKLTDAENKVNQVEQNPPQDLPADAQQALQQAADALKNATMQAVQSKRSEASAQAQQGIAAMQQAQGALAQAMAQAQAQGQAAMGQGMGQGQGQSGQKGQIAATGAVSDTGDGKNVMGGFGSGGGPAQVVGGLSPKDRDAITQYQAEKTPPEYAPMVQQYLKNLADSSGSP